MGKAPWASGCRRGFISPCRGAPVPRAVLRVSFYLSPGVLRLLLHWASPRLRVDYRKSKPRVLCSEGCAAAYILDVGGSFARRKLQLGPCPCPGEGPEVGESGSVTGVFTPGWGMC